MYTLDNLNNPQFVTEFLRALKFPQTALEAWFPSKQIESTKARIGREIGSGAVAVAYRAFDAELPIGKRDGIIVNEVSLTPLGEKRVLGEEESYKLSAIQSGDWSAYVQTAFDDLENITQGIYNRWELDRGAILNTGKLTAKAVGTSATIDIDFQVPVGNKITEATLWSDTANADVLARLLAISDTYTTTNKGLAPGAILVSRTVYGYILRNVKLLSSMLTIGGGVGTQAISPLALQAQLGAYGLPQIIVVDETIIDIDGNAKSVIDTNKAIFVPPAEVSFGETLQGPTLDAMNLVQAGALTRATAPGILGQSRVKDGTAQRINQAEALGFPVLNDPNRLMIVTVA